LANKLYHILAIRS